jgi:hypothetical protein
MKACVVSIGGVYPVSNNAAANLPQPLAKSKEDAGIGSCGGHTGPAALAVLKTGGEKSHSNKGIDVPDRLLYSLPLLTGLFDEQDK